jgi:hypothetical protein
MTTVDFVADVTGGHVIHGPHEKLAAGHAEDFPNGHGADEAHPMPAVGEHNPPAPAIRDARPTPAPLGLASTDLPDGQVAPVTHSTLAVGDHKQPAPAKGHSHPNGAAPVLAPFSGNEGPLLALLADIVDDLEATRTANENRLRTLTRDEPDSDGIQRGFGLPIDMPQVAAVADLVGALEKLEHQAVLELQRALRKHPLGPWVKRTKGVGEKQGARLIAAIGDPYWNSLHNRPRLVSELWAYCGLHVLPAAHSSAETQAGVGGGGKQGDADHATAATHGTDVGVAPTRTRGQKANWNDTARKRAWLVADKCVMSLRKPCERTDGDDYAIHVDGCACSPYRLVYDAARIKYQDAVHKVPCRRCGPAGHPAETGTPLSMAHKKARAVRIVAKEILRDLWLESKRLHETT